MEGERAMKVERSGVQSELASIALLADGSTYSSELNSLTLFKLLTSFEKVMERFKLNEERNNHTIEQYPFSIENEKENISKLIRLKPTVSFIDIFQSCQTRLHACFAFLALLDLLQLGEIGIFIGEGFNNFYLADANSENAHAN